MSSHTKKLLEKSRRVVDLPVSGWTIKIRRANPYNMMATGIPMGTLIQDLSTALKTLMSADELSDEVACKLNANAPDAQDLYEKLLMECVIGMKIDEGEWVRTDVVPNDVEPGDDGIRVDDFICSLDPADLGVLQTEIWELNGMGGAVAKLLAPFRGGLGGDTGLDGEAVRDPADGDPQAH